MNEDRTTCGACGGFTEHLDFCLLRPFPKKAKRHLSRRRLRDILSELAAIAWVLYEEEEESPPPYVGAHNSRCGGGCRGLYYADPRVPCGCNCH